MAAASVLPPTISLKDNSSAFQDSSSTLPTPNMNSSGDQPRKPSEDATNPPVRQSLPSISEVISGAKPQYSTSVPSNTSNSTLPSPFATSESRLYPESDARTSPRLSTFHPPRPDALPPFSGSPRSNAFGSRPSLPPVSDRRHSPPSSISNGLPLASSEPQLHTGPYGHAQAPPAPPPLSMTYQNGQPPPPPGQVPLPSYSMSSRQGGPLPGSNVYEHPRGSHVDDVDPSSRQRYDSTLSRHFESWSYQEALKRIGSCSRTIFNFAESYGRFAMEQNTSHPGAEQLPSEHEVGNMLANVELMKRSLEQVREAVQVSIQNERARDGAKAKHYEEQEDVSMYNDGLKQQYQVPEVKKRRGRAAPPGRCHSCNRIDTPEWRRGPDGARTLCNACGLHYAKIERKRQLEARAIRSKPEERS